jgi:hypothetical protein
MTRATGWGWLLWIALAAGCNESSPVDMWIGIDPDAGAGFEAPVRDLGTGVEEDGGTPGTGGAEGGTTGSGGAAGAAGGTTGSGGAAGDDGSGGLGGSGGDGAST